MEGQQSDYLMTFKPAPDGGGGQQSIEMGRLLSAEETEQLRAAESLVVRLTSRSEYAEVRRAADHFSEEVERLARSESLTHDFVRQRSSNIERDFQSWLSAVRSFDDRTKVWLSREFGKDSDSYRIFGQALSAEFDRNFAYRLACGLRNVAHHVGRVLNDMHFSDGIDSDSVEVVIRIDGRELAVEAPKLRAATRAELAATEGCLEARWIINSATESCEKAHVQLLLALWDQADAAARLIEGMHEEALRAGGILSLFIARDEASRKRHMGVRDSFYGHAELLRNNHAAAQALMAMPIETFVARDFIDPASTSSARRRPPPDGIHPVEAS